MHAKALCLVGDGEADDVVQEVFLRLMRRGPEDDAAMVDWLCTTTTNLARNPPAARVAELRRKAVRPLRWPLFAVPALAAAAALALFVVPHLSPPTPPDVLTKGPYAAFVVHRGRTAWPARAAETLRAGDVLQPRLPSEGLNAVLIALSSTGAKRIAETRTNGPQPLPSLTLDAAPEPMRLLLAWSHQPLDAEELRRLCEEALVKARGDVARVEAPSGDGLHLDVATLLVLREP